MNINIASYPNVNKLLKTVDNIDISIHENVIRFILKISDKKTFQQIKKATDSLQRQLFYTLCKNDVEYIVDKSDQIIQQNSHAQYVHPKYAVIKSTLERAFNNPEPNWNLNVKDVTVERHSPNILSLCGYFFLSETIEEMLDTVPFNIYAIDGSNIALRPQLEKLKFMIVNVENYSIKD